MSKVHETGRRGERGTPVLRRSFMGLGVVRAAPSTDFAFEPVTPTAGVFRVEHVTFDAASSRLAGNVTVAVRWGTDDVRLDDPIRVEAMWSGDMVRYYLAPGPAILRGGVDFLVVRGFNASDAAHDFRAGALGIHAEDAT